MTSNESQFSNKAPLAHLISIYIADGTPMPVCHKGTSSPPPPHPPVCPLVTPIIFQSCPSIFFQLVNLMN